MTEILVGIAAAQLTLMTANRTLDHGSNGSRLGRGRCLDGECFTHIHPDEPFVPTTEPSGEWRTGVNSRFFLPILASWPLPLLGFGHYAFGVLMARVLVLAGGSGGIFALGQVLLSSMAIKLVTGEV
jgi:hypothetical protein